MCKDKNVRIISRKLYVCSFVFSTSKTFCSIFTYNNSGTIYSIQNNFIIFFIIIFIKCSLPDFCCRTAEKTASQAGLAVEPENVNNLGNRSKLLKRAVNHLAVGCPPEK